MKKKIAFLTFENYWQRKNIGSSRIRARWLLKYMPEAEMFVQGKDYETVIFQKVYWKEYVRGFKGQKILDLADPDWLEGAEVMGIINHIDAITVSSRGLEEAVKKITNKPVYYIPDRVDFDGLPEPKNHKGNGTAKKIVWFGYSHNAEVLEQATMKLGSLGLELIVISEGNFVTSDCKVTNIPWNEETVNNEIQKADFALMPRMKYGRWKYKSDNKVVQCWALGMPVAQVSEDVDKFMQEDERIKESNKRYKEAKEKFDVRLSVEELREIL